MYIYIYLYTGKMDSYGIIYLKHTSGFKVFSERHLLNPRKRAPGFVELIMFRVDTGLYIPYASKGPKYGVSTVYGIVMMVLGRYLLFGYLVP